LGILGIENRKPKIVNCKFFSLFLSRQQVPKKIKFNFLFNFFKFFRVRVDSRGRGGREREGREMRPCGRPCPRGRWAASAPARPHPCVCTDALPIFTARTWFLPRPRVKPRPRVNADAGGRPDDVRGRPDGHFHPKTSVMTSLRARPLSIN
jgi:hypothetical protein